MTKNWKWVRALSLTSYTNCFAVVPCPDITCSDAPVLFQRNLPWIKDTRLDILAYLGPSNSKGCPQVYCRSHSYATCEYRMGEADWLGDRIHYFCTFYLLPVSFAIVPPINMVNQGEDYHCSLRMKSAGSPHELHRLHRLPHRHNCGRHNSSRKPELALRLLIPPACNSWLCSCKSTASSLLQSFLYHRHLLDACLYRETSSSQRRSNCN